LYCTEFLLHGEGVDEDATRAFLTTMGDCELLVGASPLFKVHVHTNEPGTVLAYMTAQGEVSEVHIHNMKLQSAERGEKLAASAAPTPPKALGYVAVCMGTGTAKILGSQGIDYIVSGGQTMNPSTRDFLDAINAVNAQSVIVFPNNSNVIMSATQAAELSDKPVGVIPTKSVPQSFSAMVVADPEASLEENVAAMTSAVAAVRFGEVTVAVKKAKTANGATIHKNDVIGLADGAIDVVGKNVNAVALDLISVIAADADMLTILAGRDLPQSDFDALLTAIEERFPDLEVDPHRGEQPLYPLVMGAE
jgi:DAK2 domain fusion protein YloV